MAITVKDIQEKDFSILANNGYDPDQVDDFLDEIAIQLNAVLTENKSLRTQAEALRGELDAAQAEKAKLEKQVPDYNETGYFKNLENAMRETLIGAQRIADQTIAEANAQAEKTVADANAQSEKTVADANAQADSILDAAKKVLADADAQSEKIVADASAQADSIIEAAKKTVADLDAEAERLRTLVSNYRNGFEKLIGEQLAALNNNALI